MITLTFQFADQQELQSFVASLKHSAPAPVVAQAEAAAAEATAASTPAEPPRKRGRPRKTESVAPAAAATNAASSDQSSAPPVPKDEPAQHTLSIDDARIALQELVTSQGMDKGFEILGQFGAARVGELKAEDYDAFVAACKAA